MTTTEAIAVVMIVGMTCGIPLTGLTIRFALKPLVEAFIRLREAQMNASQLPQLRERVAHLERLLELHGLADRPSPVSLAPITPEHLPAVTQDRERV
jgi:hypothetical protein